MDNKNNQSSYINALEKNAHLFTLPYLLSQLLNIGILPENISFKSIDSNQSHMHIIHSLKVRGDIAYVFLNMGLYASQSKLKDFSNISALIDNESFSDIADFWLKETVCFLHPELSEKYYELYLAAVNAQIYNPRSKAQLCTQLGYILSEYNFSVDVKNINQKNNIQPVTLGKTRLKINNTSLGCGQEDYSRIIISIYCEEYIFDFPALLKRLELRWLNKHRKLWRGFQLLVIQKNVGYLKHIFLPNKLSKNSLLNTPERLLAKIEL